MSLLRFIATYRWTEGMMLFILKIYRSDRSFVSVALVYSLHYYTYIYYLYIYTYMYRTSISIIRKHTPGWTCATFNKSTKYVVWIMGPGSVWPMASRSVFTALQIVIGASRSKLGRAPPPAVCFSLSPIDKQRRSWWIIHRPVLICNASRSSTTTKVFTSSN